MGIELIRTWYNGARDYSLGVSLYASLGGREELVTIMKKGETQFTRVKLEEEMVRIYRGEHLQNNDEVDVSVKTYESPTDKTPDDPVLKELYLRKVALHKEKDLLRYQLENFPNDSERGAAAHRILKLRAEITEIWSTEDFYKKHGQLPTNVTGVTDPGMLMHRRTIVRGNIRRLRQLLKKDPDHPGHLRSMAKFEAESQSLKDLIKKYKEHGKTA